MVSRIFPIILGSVDPKNDLAIKTTHVGAFISVFLRSRHPIKKLIHKKMPVRLGGLGIQIASRTNPAVFITCGSQTSVLFFFQIVLLISLERCAFPNLISMHGRTQQLCTSGFQSMSHQRWMSPLDEASHKGAICRPSRLSSTYCGAVGRFPSGYSNADDCTRLDD